MGLGLFGGCTCLIHTQNTSPWQETTGPWAFCSSHLSCSARHCLEGLSSRWRIFQMILGWSFWNLGYGKSGKHWRGTSYQSNIIYNGMDTMVLQVWRYFPGKKISIHYPIQSTSSPSIIQIFSILFSPYWLVVDLPRRQVEKMILEHFFLHRLCGGTLRTLAWRGPPDSGLGNPTH